jgi:hypothetical protein
MEKKTRSYSICNEDDMYHINNGRCPTYALTWGLRENSLHWPEGHDYFLGNGINFCDQTQQLREILSKKFARGTLHNYIVFCDLDGVLADFEQGFQNKFHKNPDTIKPSLLWSLINKSHTFFETLPWMPKGRELWDNIKQYDPIIITGIPRGNSTAIEQKLNWCQRELGPDIHVITCSTKDKPKFCLSNSILIDDRTDNLKPWSDKGGKFLLYNEDYFDKIVERIHIHMASILPSP